MKRVVTKQELDTLVKANDTVRGTHDYMKYFMMMEYKTKQNGKWSAWKYSSLISVRHLLSLRMCSF